MSSLRYCIKCGEAVETETVMSNLRRTVGGLFSSGYQWDNVTLAICVNTDCSLFGVAMRRVTMDKPKK